MTPSDTSATPRPRKPRPAPGPPVEVWIWRIETRTGHGEHRSRVDNVLYEHWEYVWSHRHPGAGRYRIEFRDARRSIVKVIYANALDPKLGARVDYTKGRVRPSKRTVPPPQPAWQPWQPAHSQPVPQPSAPRPVAQPRVQPTQPKPARVAYPLLRPPGQAPPGHAWLMSRERQWCILAPNQGLPDECHLLRLPSGEFVYVYAPDGRWPGYRAIRLDDGQRCLVPGPPR